MAEQKYKWLKLQSDFFSSKRIKKLRKISGGDTFTIIYLKMQLLSLKDEGVLEYTGLENSFAEELALDLDEDVDNVVKTLQYLESCGLIETSDDINFFLPYVKENTGSESGSAKRMREKRKRDKDEPSHCDGDVTQPLRSCDTEKEKEKDKEEEKEEEKEEDKEKEIINIARSRAAKQHTPEPVADTAALILNDGAEWLPAQVLFNEYVRLYPNVDIKQQFNEMRAWCINNPTKRKTIKGIKRFVGNWLSKEQDKGSGQSSLSGNSYVDAIKNRVKEVDNWV